MKFFALLIPFLAVSSAFASTETICYFRSDSDLELTITSEGHQILGGAFYNVDWAQTAEGHFSKAVSQSNHGGLIEVTLENGSRFSVPASVLDGKDGEATVTHSDDTAAFGDSMDYGCSK